LNDAVTLAALEGIWKFYGGVAVLESVDLSVHPGEIHALVGGNGAGKSTLMKILAGVVTPDDGTITVRGTAHTHLTPALAHRIGISMVPQEPELFPNMTVLENIDIALDRRIRAREVRETFEALGHTIDNNRLAGSLSISDQQLVEIAKGVLRKADILVVDEPTAALTEHEVDRLFALLRTLRELGFGIFYISHRLHEIPALCDTVSVLRDGEVVLHEVARETTPEQLIDHMIPVGEEREGLSRSVEWKIADEPALDVRELTGVGFHEVSLTVRPGEVTALAGPVGSGRTELAEAIFGIRSSSGEILLNGESYDRRTPLKSLQLGLAYLPEDRHAHGIFLDALVFENISSSVLDRISRIAINRREDRELAEQWDERLKVSGATIDDIAARLSGGNQQKVVLAKYLATTPKVLILDEPSRGVDAGARADLYRTINELSADGLAILLISSDLEEVVMLADRVLVMRNGRLSATLEQEDVAFGPIRDAAFAEVTL
jgi:AI-2 transport system ATP-binding protein